MQDEDFDFDYAERRDTLDDLPKEHHEAYVPAEGGGFVVRPGLKDRFAEWREGRAARKKELADAIARRDEAEQQRAKSVRRLRDMLAAAAIEQALRDGGCLPKFLAGATAILLRDLPIEIEDVDGEFFAALDGGGSIDHAVKMWLAGQEGAVFCAQRDLPGSGLFGGMFADLRKQLH